MKKLFIFSSCLANNYKTKCQNLKKFANYSKEEMENSVRKQHNNAPSILLDTINLFRYALDNGLSINQAWAKVCSTNKSSKCHPIINCQELKNDEQTTNSSKSEMLNYTLMKVQRSGINEDRRKFFNYVLDNKLDPQEVLESCCLDTNQQTACPASCEYINSQGLTSSRTEIKKRLNFLTKRLKNINNSQNNTNNLAAKKIKQVIDLYKYALANEISGNAAYKSCCNQ